MTTDAENLLEKVKASKNWTNHVAGDGDFSWRDRDRRKGGALARNALAGIDGTGELIVTGLSTAWLRDAAAGRAVAFIYCTDVTRRTTSRGINLADIIRVTGGRLTEIA